MKQFTYGAAGAAAVAFFLLHPWTLLAATPAANGNPEVCDKAAHDTVARSVVIPEDASPALGAQSAPVTLVEFTDYQCPYCLHADATVAALRAKYGAKVRWVVKQMPMPLHDRAEKAALAALAAQEQGKFFEMHKALFAHPEALDDASIAGYASAAGLNLSAFEAALADPRVKASLDADRALGKKLEVRGVPAFFINGKPLQGAQPQAAFEALIDAALAKK